MTMSKLHKTNMLKVVKYLYEYRRFGACSGHL